MLRIECENWLEDLAYFKSIEAKLYNLGIRINATNEKERWVELEFENEEFYMQALKDMARIESESSRN